MRNKLKRKQLSKDKGGSDKSSMASVKSSSHTPTTHEVPPRKPKKEILKEEISEESLRSYHAWLKEKQMHENGNKKIRDDQEEEDDVDEDGEGDGEDGFRVDAVLERGPSPPESENASTYEWSYEEQFKQLYDIDEDPDRKAFLDEYFEFMKARGTPVSRIPIMAKQILDLFHLYNLVVKHGGLVQVIRNKQWSKITKGLSLPTSITSAAFTLRTQYLKYLYPYECAMHNFSTPKELQAAIDSNRRDRFSSLYHTEPTMTPSRDDRYSPFPLNGCDYPATQARHHIPHPPLTPSQMDVRFNLKRPSDAMMSKPFEKYSVENPKVIVLQDGTISDNRHGKMTPPPFHGRATSPTNEMRALAEIEARRRSHHFQYGKDWDGDARHLIEEETRRRVLEETRKTSTSSFLCKDKNCNSADCQYARQNIHQHRRIHDPMAMCPCAYCKEYSSHNSYSPAQRDIARHHMDGASATPSHDSSQANGQLPLKNQDTDSTEPTIHHRAANETDSNNHPMTTLRMKLPDVRSGGDSIFLSLEVEGVVYEGTITAKSHPNQPTTVKNGHFAKKVRTEEHNNNEEVVEREHHGKDH